MGLVFEHVCVFWPGEGHVLYGRILMYSCILAYAEFCEACMYCTGAKRRLNDRA